MTQKEAATTSRQEIETRILTAAEKVFAEFGLKGATMDRIAKAADLPKANVHYYFSTKENLYRTLIQDVCDEWLEAAMVFERGSDPATVLRAYIEAKMDLSRRRPYGSRVWASEIMSGAKVTRDYIENDVKEWFQGREEILNGWIEDGKIEPLDTHTLMFMMWAVTQHFADFGPQIAILNGGTDLSETQFDQAKETVVRVILKGVGAVA